MQVKQIFGSSYFVTALTVMLLIYYLNTKFAIVDFTSVKHYVK